MAAFVGRAEELKRLTRLPLRSRSAPGAAAGLIVGAPGSGKSRLLAEASQQLRGVRIVRLVGYEPVQAVPLAAASDLIRDLDLLQERDPVRIFEAAHAARLRRGLSVLVVDDLQWVDELSLGLLHYLLRSAEGVRAPLTVLAASRPAAGATSFRDALGSLLPDDRREQIELGPIDEEAGVDLVRGLDPSVTIDRAMALWTRANGSPFWLQALALADGNADASNLIADRVAGIGVEGGAVLGALAVAARPVREDELEQLVERPVEAVRSGIADLVARGLAVTGPSGVSFAHDLIRDAALQGLPAARARRLHARLAATIEEDAWADLGQLREALVHRQAAGLPAGELAMRLLRSPQRRLLGRDGLGLVAAIGDALDRADRARAELKRAVAALAADIGEQEVALERWSDVARSERDAVLRAQAEVAAGTAAYRLGRTAEARGAVGRARAATEEARDRATQIRLDGLDASILLWLEHRTAEGAAMAARALAAAKRLADDAGGARHLGSIGLRAYESALEAASDAATQESRWDDLLAHATELESLIDVLENESSSVDALTRVGAGLRQTGRSGAAVRVLERAWRESIDRVLPTSRVEIGHWLALVLMDVGRLPDAHAIAVETAQLENRLGHGSPHWSWATRLVHHIELSTGDSEAALDGLRHFAAAEPDRHHELGVRQEIATWLAKTLGTAAAEEIDRNLAAARSASEEVACPRCGAELAVVDAEIQARLGRIPEAEAKLRGWREHATASLVEGVLLERRTEAALAAASGDGLVARQAAEAALAAVQQVDRQVAELWARIDLGRILAPSDRAEAVRVYTQAAEQAGRMGAVTEGRIIGQALRRLGVRTWRRTPATSGGQARPGELESLSVREREVAERIAGGATNAEIAATLGISPKTVERHTTNVFAKLGLRNRAELASFVSARAGTGFSR
jgi:DNA-binding CsgD family transcriptional regulator